MLFQTKREEAAYFQTKSTAIPAKSANKGWCDTCLKKAEETPTFAAIPSDVTIRKRSRPKMVLEGVVMTVGVGGKALLLVSRHAVALRALALVSSRGWDTMMT